MLKSILYKRKSEKNSLNTSRSPTIHDTRLSTVLTVKTYVRTKPYAHYKS